MSSAVILVVDDEPVVLRIVQHILARAGYEVLAAASPEEAVSIGHGHPGPIRLMLSDVLMPGLTGPALADALASVHPEMQVLFMAGLPNSQEVCEQILGRGRPFLPKPFMARTLLEKVAELVSRGVAAP